MSNLDHALALAKQGLHVFPLLPREKTPLTKHGFKDATRDEALIRNWWRTTPTANIGIATGEVSGIVVLDVDIAHGGVISLLKMLKQDGPLPSGPAVLTGGGGNHYYYKHPGTKVGNRTNILRGIDVRGDGGYVVAPASVHPNGRTYRWIPSRAFGEVELQPMPAFMAGKTKSSSTQPPPSSDLDPRERAQRYADALDPAAEGSRNDNAFRNAGNILALESDSGQRLSIDEVVEIMRTWNARNLPPLEDAELRACVESASTNGTPRPPKRPKAKSGEKRGVDPKVAPKDGRERIYLHAGKRHEAIDEAIALLAKPGEREVFQRAGQLVTVVRSPEGLGPRERQIRRKIHVLNENGLADLLSQRAEFVNCVMNKKTGEMEFFATDCSNQFAKALIARGEWPHVRYLTHVAHAPTILASGRIVQTGGYDAEARAYFDFGEKAFPPVPSEPTLEDAREAMRTVISPILRDFPFEGPAHRAVVLSAIMSAVARCAFDHVPVHAISAPVMASGKTLLADAVAIVAEGRASSPISQADADDEFEKRIQGVQLEGQAVAVIDNVQRPVTSAALCTAITSMTSGIRLFGTQTIIRVPTWSTLWIVTGNNLAFDKDFRSRVLLARIDPRLERPEHRSFAIPDLRSHLHEHRARIIGAILLILRAHFLAGRPTMELKPLNRFEGWSATIRSALVWIGEADPVETMDEIARDDESTSYLHTLLTAVHKVVLSADFTAFDIVQMGFLGSSLREVLEPICLSRNGTALDSRRLGRFFQQNVQRIVGGLRLEVSSKGQGVNRYRIRSVEPPGSAEPGGSGGSGGSVPPQREEESTDVHAGARACARVCNAGEQPPPLQPLQPNETPAGGADPNAGSSPEARVAKASPDSVAVSTPPPTTSSGPYRPKPPVGVPPVTQEEMDRHMGRIRTPARRRKSDDWTELP